MGSSSVSIESAGNPNNTSTDSSNTVITMVTVTDGGDTEDSLDYSGPQSCLPGEKEDTIRITSNLLEDMLDKTPGSSLDREEEFFSASSTEDPPAKQTEEVKMIFLAQEYDDEDDEALTPLMQYTSVPRENDSSGILEESKLPINKEDPDTSLEWYNIKMRQTTIMTNKNNALSNSKRLKLLSKRYAKNNFEEDRLHHSRGSSGFAAEQMTIESEDSYCMTTNSSPPVPDSPTGNSTAEKPEEVVSETKFTFSPPATETVEEPPAQPPVPTPTPVPASAPAQPPAPKEEITKDTLALERAQRKPRSERRSISMESAPTLRRRDSGEIRTATIVVQQASVTGGSPEGGNNDFLYHHMHDFDIKYMTTHHSRSQSVKTSRGVSGAAASRHRPNYLCLPQQRSRVASMPNTGVEEEYYRLRHFSITGKGVVNRGDSLKSRRSRSNTSVASSNSSHSIRVYRVVAHEVYQRILYDQKISLNTEHQNTSCQVFGGGSYPGSARTSATTSLASSRESSCASCPGITAPYRVVMLGSAGVGKSSLISQFMTSEYLHAYDTSIDDEFGEKSVSVLLDGEESELTFIDHPSSEMNTEDCLSQNSSPHAYCVVYSTADRNSFQYAEESLQALWKSENIRSKAVILVANKTDLVRSRVVSTQDGKLMATSYDCKFIETSVGINHNVDELLVGILTQIRLKQENPSDQGLQQHTSRRRSRSPLGASAGFRKYRGTRTSASLKVKGLLSKVWARDSKSKSCENLHVL